MSFWRSDGFLEVVARLSLRLSLRLSRKKPTPYHPMLAIC